MSTVWNEAKTRIHQQIPHHMFKTWISPIKCLKTEDDHVVLGCPNVFFRDWVARHYQQLIQTEIEKLSGRIYKIKLDLCDMPMERVTPKEDAPQPTLPHVPLRYDPRPLFQKNHTFDQFVVGTCNDFAYNAALTLAGTKTSAYHSLFLLSETGLGKSHLTQAIGNHALSESPSLRVCYVTAEEFTNSMVHALRYDKIEQFKQRYRKQCDVLLLEDIQFLSGKTKTQDELAFTLDALYDAGKKIIFTGTYLPDDIPKMNDKLKSRITSGVMSKIESPDYETRLRILRKKAAAKHADIPEDVLQYLAAKLSQNVRQLESGLIGLVAKASLLNLPIDLRLAESIVSKLVRRAEQITIDMIQSLVCKHYKLSKEDLISRSRKRDVTQPRQIAMFLARKHTTESLQTIGRSFNRYHATALHAIGTIDKLVRENGSAQKQVEFLSQKIEGGNL